MNSLDIMVDLETLAVNDSPVIIQLSGVIFDRMTGKTYEEFNELISPESGITSGLSVNGDTVAWWLTQECKVIKDVFLKSITSGKKLDKVLMAFSKFINDVKKTHNVESISLWGNGILSDNLWIQSNFKAVGLAECFQYNEHRDVRTLVQVGIDILGKDFKKDTTFVGNEHNAIDDCHHQIKYCVKINKELKKIANK
jgi:hypothetical protein